MLASYALETVYPRRGNSRELTMSA
jgi:hypothetical protein